MQYTSIERDRILIFAFRLRSDKADYLCFPIHIDGNENYDIYVDDVACGLRDGSDIKAWGILFECETIFCARIVELTKHSS
jgi:hypothetical protein